MCLAVLALHAVPGIPVLIAANRDEFHARPTLAAAQWPDAAGIYAGRDALAGGTWMGASSHGRYALVTNFREPGLNRADAPSRGALVERYLRGDEPPAEYMARVHDEGQAYNGFNLIVGDMEQAWYVSNRDGAPRRLVAGLYALSNHLLDTPWPKLARTKRAFADVLRQGPQPDLPALYTALADREPAADDELPATGLPPDREKLLSSPFIVSPTYGTRSSTVLALREHGAGLLHERRYAPDGTLNGESELLFELPAEYAGARTPDAVAGRNA